MDSRQTPPDPPWSWWEAEVVPNSPVPRALTIHITAQHGFLQWVHTALLQPLLDWGCVQADEVLGLTGTTCTSASALPTSLPNPSLQGPQAVCLPPRPPCVPCSHVQGVGAHTLRKGVLGEISKAPLWPCSSCRASWIALVTASPSPRKPMGVGKERKGKELRGHPSSCHAPPALPLALHRAVAPHTPKGAPFTLAVVPTN